MPAIRPDLLKRQSADLAEAFRQPQAFLRGLHELLDLYANRAYRPGQAGKPRSLLPAYEVPPPVLRQLLIDLAPKAGQDPEAALALCRALWDESYLETRLLAAGLLGKSPSEPEKILDLLQDFLSTAVNERVFTTLFNQGLAWLRLAHPDSIIERAKDWLASREESQQMLGLRILPPLIAEPGYENMPVFFKLLAQLACEAPSNLRPDLIDVFTALARRSPPETAFFLRENLARPSCTTAAWLTRQVLAAFPAEIGAGLRERLRQFSV